MKLVTPLKTSLTIVAISATLPVLFLGFYLFRTETLDNPDLGIIEHRYRWGYAYEERADTNRDGSHDFRAIFNTKSRSFATHDQPSEFWEDRDYNGVFEIHALLKDGQLERVEIDQDQDGKYDRELFGEEALQFFKSLIGPR